MGWRVAIQRVTTYGSTITGGFAHYVKPDGFTACGLRAGRTAPAPISANRCRACREAELA